jgi:hypothetical protein
VILSALVTILVVRLSRDSGRPALAAERRPLAFSDSSAACESCHPRHTSEWRRSVMAHASTSPLFQSLELLIQEQVGKSADCPAGAGVLRRRDAASACRDRVSGHALTGSGGEGWCVNCHAPGQNLGGRQPGWDARSPFGPDNRPLGELLSPAAHDGIGCTFCHQVAVPGAAGAVERGNARWLSAATGASFSSRPSSVERRLGIGNSGYALDPRVLLESGGGELVPGGAHRVMSDETRAYLGSSQFCGTCHDVRLFGTDVLGAARGENFKRLRNAYSEWVDFAREEERLGRAAPSCQDCHLSNFPGVCVSGAGPSGGACPPGTHFEERPPGDRPRGFAAAASTRERELHPHYLSGIEVPFAPEFDPALAAEKSLDSSGIPLGGRARRDLLLSRSVRLSIGTVERRAGSVEIPITVENVGAGHRVPAGFSQERELWVHLEVTDASGRRLYEVGRVERGDEDLADKRFLRVNVDDGRLDAEGRPLGVFGADVADGPDAPRWDPPPDLGGTRFRGRGLVNFQNGFLRCVRCIGRIDAAGNCQALAGQESTRAGRFADGDYDLDTGACGSNLTGRAALFETYFPIGALDASRGVAKAPDAIIDTRSLAPKTPVTYVYVLDALPRGRLRVTARLLFRAYPPYLVRAFAAYEARMQARGLRRRGPLVREDAARELEIVEVARASADAG